jgi:hypothetical protein
MKIRNGFIGIVVLSLLVPALLSPDARAQSVVDSSTLQGKVLFGYQGWFSCAGDGSGHGNWRTWARGTPAAETLTIDMYPDLSELDPDELYPVPNMTIGGKPAFLYSANNRKTVLRHFQWMKEYGLDGVLVQRFVGSIRGKRHSGDVVLKNVMAGAEKYGRTFAIEYDITGGDPDTFFQALREDWQYLVDDLKVTSHPNYLHHNGKPVLSIWGMGLEEDRHVPRDPETARQVIEWFKTKAPKPYQVTYMGGTPSRWRTLTYDCRNDPRWTDVFRMMDVIQPWTVGRYRDNDTADQWKSDMLGPDLAWTAANGPLYMPVVFPGFSWHNLKHETPKNAIPRNRGEFLWRQAFNAKQAGAVMLKIAMFDEVNESTAMFKLAARRSDAPDQGYWLTLDADGYELPSDWYLRIAGEITRMFHGEVAPTPNLPEKLGPPRKAELEKPASVRSATVSNRDTALPAADTRPADNQIAPLTEKKNMSGNPLFEGWYADPEVMIYGKTYWIYPTYSDAYEKQVFFDCFSSPDLVNWTKHERILDTTGVSWAKRAMWAPSVIEKDGRYYLFFGANDVHEGEIGGIGVAAAEKPQGPYHDLIGKPLINDIVNGAQPIDQYVFFNKKDNSYYMYYGGWGHCNIVRLDSSFTKLAPFEDGTLYREVTPKGYVEGPCMFSKDGKFYFMWSEGGWGGPDYSVAYAISDSIFGPFERIGKILEQDTKVATGAGHHSVLHVPGTDQWYIVYHRRPLRETHPNHRVTCIDRMEFEPNGHIKPVKITFEGVCPQRIP